jgi:hypothetical protein
MERVNLGIPRNFIIDTLMELSLCSFYLPPT